MATKIKFSVRLAILIVLMLFSAAWFLSFYIKMPATGTGIGTDTHTDMRLKGVTYGEKGKNNNNPVNTNSAFSDDEIKINPGL